MKIWLDDTRPAPEGWTHLDHPDEVIEMLLHAPVSEISLDHDLGIVEGGKERTGYDVLTWIEREAAVSGYRPPVISIHTANSAAYVRMAAARAAITRLATTR